MANGQVVASMPVSVDTCKAKHRDVENQIADCRTDIQRVEKNVGKLFDKLDSFNMKLWGILAAAITSVIASIVIQLLTR